MPNSQNQARKLDSIARSPKIIGNRAKSFAYYLSFGKTSK